MSANVKRLLSELSRVTRELGEQVKADYPIAAPIKWQNLSANGGVSSGCVVSHGYLDRIKVRNEKTGSEFWITANRIV